MQIELECKLHVTSHAPTREKLRQLGARFIGTVQETNTLFDLADRALQHSDRGLRVRSIVVLEGESRKSTLTYKGPRMPGPFKRREEIEVRIDDTAAMAAILRALGYAERIIFEKRRESWVLGPCRIELDELPRLGLFVEIEGPDDSAVRSALAALGLSEAASIIDTYVAMVATLAGPDEFRPVELRFDHRKTSP